MMRELEQWISKKHTEILKRMCGPKTKVVAGGWGKLPSGRLTTYTESTVS
jgi:hypothetical protein